MIKLIIGGIGSGKSTSAVRDIVMSNHKVFCNFNIKSSNAVRLKTEHIIKDVVVGQTKKGEDITKKVVNWDFWNEIKEEGFSIVIDEVHNVLHSRRSMTSWNVLFSTWIAQIRKILSDHPDYHLVLISQKLERIDISVRDLAQEIVYCSKREWQPVKTKVYNSRSKKISQKMLPKTYIIKHYFKGTYCQEKFNTYLMTGEGTDYITYFFANPLFRYFDSYELLDFGNEVYI